MPSITAPNPIILAAIASISGQSIFAADAIYLGGNILTMAGDAPNYTEAERCRDPEICGWHT